MPALPAPHDLHASHSPPPPGAPHATARRARSLIPAAVLCVALLILSATVACTTADSGTARPAVVGGAVTVSRAELLSVTKVGADTLSDSAYLTGVYPEADGEAVAFTFADPARRVRAGLAILQRDAPPPALLWPDSVTAVWWSAPHAISFTTASGRGVHAVVDVHAQRATVTEDTAGRAPSPARINPSDPARARATAYIDSVHVQPVGRPQESSLRYLVTAWRASPDGRLGAFYAIATDSAGRQMNPAWYAMNIDAGTVAPIDEVVGPISEMRESAAGWTADGHFIYAKRQTLWNATVQAGPSRPASGRG